MKLTLFSTLMLAAVGTTAMAQWTRTNGPEGASFAALAADDSMVVGSMSIGGTLRLTDGAWEEREAPPLYDLVLADRTLFARGQLGQYVSHDYGGSWKMVYSPGIVMNIGGLPFMTVNDSLYSWKGDADAWTLAGAMPGTMKPAAYKSSLYMLAGESRDTLVRSPNRGATWMAVASDLASHGNPGRFIASGPDGLYMGWHTEDVYRSTDDGATWHPLGEGITPGSRIDWIVSNRTTVWAGDHQTIHRLHDGKWEAFPLPFSAEEPIPVEEGIVVNTESGPFMVGNGATAPASLSAGLHKLDITALGTIGSIINASSWNGTYRSTDAGDHWTKSASIGMTRFAPSGGAMIAISGEAYRSADSGATWEPLTPRLGGSTNMQCLLETPRALYIGHGDVLLGNDTISWLDGGIYRSTDHGITWQAADVGLPVRDGETVPVLDLAADADTIVALTADGIYASRNGGESWFEAPMGLPAGMHYEMGGKLLAMGGSIYLFTIEGLFGSTNHGELWTPVNIDIPSSLVIAAFPAVVDDRIYLQAFELPGDGSQKAHTYTFDGESWEDAGSSMPPGIFFNAYARAGNTLFAGSRGNGVWRQTIPLSVPGARVDGASATVRPNPAAGEATLGISLEKEARVTITIVDAIGREARTVYRGALDAGAHDIAMPTDGLPTGAYFVRIDRDGVPTLLPFVKR